MDKAVYSQHPADRTALQTFANTKSRGRKSSKGGCWNIACGKKKKKKDIYIQFLHTSCRSSTFSAGFCSTYSSFPSLILRSHLGKVLVGGHRLRKQIHDCHKKKKKTSEPSLPCSALSAALWVLPSARCRVRSTRAAPRLLFGLQRMCSAWWLLLSADGRRKFLLEVQRLLLKGKEILLAALRKGRVTFLTPYIAALQQTLAVTALSHHSSLKPSLTL